jgi:hypothetical protein
MAIQFSKLVSALVGAVVEANSKIMQTQIGNLSKFFDNKGSPISTVLRIPRWSPNTPAKEQTVQKLEHVDLNVPLITLVNHNQLSIQQMQVTMQIDLNEITNKEKDTAPPVTKEWKPSTYKSVMLANTSSGKKPSDAGMSTIVITVTNDGTPEALSKLIDHFNKTI